MIQTIFSSEPIHCKGKDNVEFITLHNSKKRYFCVLQKDLQIKRLLDFLTLLIRIILGLRKVEEMTISSIDV